MEGQSSDKTIQARFITKHIDLSVPDTSYTIPETVDSSALNVFIRQLLKAKNASAKLEFDFIIDNRILRSALDTHLVNSGVSTEETIEIEYVVKKESPEPEDCLMHNDWVSGVEINGKWILTGCYDNTVNLWSKKGTHKLTMPEHTGAIKAVTWCHLDQTNGVFVSASTDQTAILWHWLIKENAVQCVTMLRGHERSIECVSSRNSMIATGGWDTYIKLWSAKVDEMDMEKSATEMAAAAEDDRNSKRSKMDESGKVRTPIVTMKGHRECVNAVKWMSNQEIVTCSWDHTIRIWDAHLGGIKKEFVGNKAFFSLDYKESTGLIITSSADRHVRLYDARSDAGSVCKQTYTSHSQWVQTVRWCPVDDNLFVSGGYDSLVKMWDIRSTTTPLYDLSGHEDKVMCCDWQSGLIVSGGADNTLRIFKDNNKVNV